eukprot:TRINITY_DN29763_c0_g1_i1.p1 TRINITY_DN29763_c0_g1~~TRINITY_DN29763_c0_g1_i1.p1  ORF type:complete len:739 (-),score=172.72 TRINITY_DN29763_c0_g1_i1:65-2281(-)
MFHRSGRFGNPAPPRRIDGHPIGQAASPGKQSGGGRPGGGATGGGTTTSGVSPATQSRHAQSMMHAQSLHAQSVHAQSLHAQSAHAQLERTALSVAAGSPSHTAPAATGKHGTIGSSSPKDKKGPLLAKGIFSTSAVMGVPHGSKSGSPGGPDQSFAETGQKRTSLRRTLHDSGHAARRFSGRSTIVTDRLSSRHSSVTSASQWDQESLHDARIYHGKAAIEGDLASTSTARAAARTFQPAPRRGPALTAEQVESRYRLHEDGMVSDEESGDLDGKPSVIHKVDDTDQMCAEFVVELSDLEVADRLQRNVHDVEALEKAEALLLVEAEKWEEMARVESNLRDCWQAELNAQQQSIKEQIDVVKDHIVVLRKKEDLANVIIKELDTRHQHLMNDTAAGEKSLKTFKTCIETAWEQVSQLRTRIKASAVTGLGPKDAAGNRRPASGRMLNETECDTFRSKVAKEFETHLRMVPTAEGLSETIDTCLCALHMETLQKVMSKMRTPQQSAAITIQRCFKAYRFRLRTENQRSESYFNNIMTRLHLEQQIPKNVLWVVIVGTSQVVSKGTQDFMKYFVEVWSNQVDVEDKVWFVVGDALGIDELVVKTCKEPMQVVAFTSLSDTRQYESMQTVSPCHVDGSMKEQVTFRIAHLAVFLEASAQQVRQYHRRDIPVVPVWRTGGTMSDMKDAMKYPSYVSDKQKQTLHKEDTPLIEAAANLASIIRACMLDRERAKTKKSAPRWN